MPVKVKGLTNRAWPAVLLIILTLLSVLAMSGAVENSARFGRHYIWLLLLNTAVMLALAILIAANLYWAVRQVRGHEPGARLTLHLVLLFILIALVPVLVVYMFSIRFLDQGIDSWFDVHVERALGDSLKLGRRALDDRMHYLQRQTLSAATALSNTPDLKLPLALTSLRVQLKASEVVVFGADDHIIAASTSPPERVVPNLPPADALRHYRQDHSYVGLEPRGGHHLQIRVLVAIPSPLGSEETSPHDRMLQVVYGVPGQMGRLASQIQDTYDHYQELTFLRTPLKQSFILTLSLVLLLSVLAAVWAALYSARRVVQPIRQLIDAIRRVAAGDLQAKLPLTRRDELALVARSFNEMTTRLLSGYEETERGRRQLERQRRYLQTVLEHLSSGVLTIDRSGVLRTSNAAADHILEFSLEPFHGRRLADLGIDTQLIYSLYQAIAERLIDSLESWEQEVELFGENGRKILICRGARLPDQSGEGSIGGGSVIVFDDVTTLIRAQRDAAWGEVARRLAHEIRNPLTPIQLSAERLRRKLLPHVNTNDARMLERSTETIVQQVEGMKQLVNAFSDYARAPVMQLSEVDFNTSVAEVIELYGAHPGISLVFLPGDDVGLLYADPGRLRQLLHNLLKNAVEAANRVANGEVIVETGVVERAQHPYVELRVSDNGAGIPEAILGQIFEPYVSGKAGGSGLGLAVVKKIVEEHHGLVWAESREGGGTRLVVRLPKWRAVTGDL